MAPILQPENQSLLRRISAIWEAKFRPVLTEVITQGVAEGVFETFDSEGVGDMIQGFAANMGITVQCIIAAPNARVRAMRSTPRPCVSGSTVLPPIASLACMTGRSRCWTAIGSRDWWPYYRAPSSQSGFATQNDVMKFGVVIAVFGVAASVAGSVTAWATPPSCFPGKAKVAFETDDAAVAICATDSGFRYKGHALNKDTDIELPAAAVPREDGGTNYIATNRGYKYIVWDTKRFVIMGPRDVVESDQQGT